MKKYKKERLKILFNLKIKFPVFNSDVGKMKILFFNPKLELKLVNLTFNLKF